MTAARPLTNSTGQPQPVMSGLWLGMWSLALAIGWLLPNHYRPWTSFHFDAWSAITFSVLTLVVLIRSAVPVQWSHMSLILAAVSLIPIAQWFGGMMVSAGNSWISAAYLLALLLTFLTGTRWAASGLQATDGLFLAIGTAAIASVGLQLHQWLALDRLDIWSMGDSSGRPFANFGQPNQLGTFLIWGLLAGAWGHVRGKVGAGPAIGYALFLLFGLSLTASRTAWIAVVLLVAAAWVWRSLWPNRRMAWIATALGLYFAACVICGNWLTQWVMGDVLFDAGSIARISGESRPAIWSLFAHAAMQRPWLGYGWNQVGVAQVSVADLQPALHVYFGHAHNLFLDLVLWCGMPIGLAVSAFLIAWLIRRAVAVRTPEQALLMLLLLVVGNHAMLELPLHHAYFLLPVGLAMGILEARQTSRPLFTTRRWMMGVLWAVAVTLLVLLVRDYWRVERSYEALRFEWARIKTLPAAEPDVVLLTQWRDYFRLVRLEPATAMSEAELRSLENAASMFPSAGLLHRLAVALAWNNRPQDAARWLRRMCNIASVAQCDAVKSAWAERAAGDARLASVPWPNQPDH